VVLIDDDGHIAELLSHTLESLGLELIVAPDGEKGLAAVRRVSPALVLLDLGLPDVSGLDLLVQLVRLSPDTEVVVLTANHSIESTVAAMKLGALDYMTKPFETDVLRERIAYWIGQPRRSPSACIPHDSLVEHAAAAGLVGKSEDLSGMVAKVLRIGPHFKSALITGPTGSGKELVAKLLHRATGRSGPFVVFNCAAVPETLFESELFGHVKGAFTGAAQDRIGIAEHASGGTLFIDEVGELALRMQPTLLRLVQNREAKRLGTSHSRNLDIRIIAATNRDLREMVRQGAFREDLYHRLSTVEIRVPGLTERWQDIPVLTDHFLKTLCTRYGRPRKTFSPEARATLMSYPWPGNVRELESVIDYCCLMCTSDRIETGDLPEFVSQRQDHGPNVLPSLHEMELRHMVRVLDARAGNREETAAALGIGRATCIAC
jgi:DNA-binding NtrC family response regulator